jgi:hypothetical protein
MKRFAGFFLLCAAFALFSACETTEPSTTGVNTGGGGDADYLESLYKDAIRVPITPQIVNQVRAEKKEYLLGEIRYFTSVNIVLVRDRAGTSSLGLETQELRRAQDAGTAQTAQTGAGEADSAQDGQTITILTFKEGGSSLNQSRIFKDDEGQLGSISPEGDVFEINYPERRITLGFVLNPEKNWYDLEFAVEETKEGRVPLALTGARPHLLIYYRTVFPESGETRIQLNDEPVPPAKGTSGLTGQEPALAQVPPQPAGGGQPGEAGAAQSANEAPGTVQSVTETAVAVEMTQPVAEPLMAVETTQPVNEAPVLETPPPVNGEMARAETPVPVNDTAEVVAVETAPPVDTPVVVETTVDEPLVAVETTRPVTEIPVNETPLAETPVPVNGEVAQAGTPAAVNDAAGPADQGAGLLAAGPAVIVVSGAGNPVPENAPEPASPPAPSPESSPIPVILSFDREDEDPPPVEVVLLIGGPASAGALGVYNVSGAGPVAAGLPGNYFTVQVGAFREQKNAARVYAALERGGFSPLYECHQDLTKVVIPAVNQKDLAWTRERIKALGFGEPYVRR